MLGQSSSTSSLLPTFSSASHSTCSSDPNNLGKGSCTGLFFQLFDWNGRLHKKQKLRRRSLPRERPSCVIVRDCHRGGCTQPAPGQKLNMVGPCGPHGDLCKHPEDSLGKEQTPPEKKKKKRSPNVVAKLMGLETMPSPDFRRDKWPAHVDRCQSPLQIQNLDERSLLSHSRIPSSRRSLVELENCTIVKSSERSGCRLPHLTQDTSSIGYHAGISSHSGECKESRRNESARMSDLSPLPFQNGEAGGILSPSNSHNRLVLPVKRTSSFKATESLSGAANRLPEPNRHPRMALNDPKIRSSENEKENAAVQELNHRKANQSSALPCQKSLSVPASRPSTGVVHASPIEHMARNRKVGLVVHENRKDFIRAQKINLDSRSCEEMDSSNCHQSQPAMDHPNEVKQKRHLEGQQQPCQQPGDSVRAKIQNPVLATAGDRVVSRGSISQKSRKTPVECRCESQRTLPSTSAMSSSLIQNSDRSAVTHTKGTSCSRKARSETNLAAMTQCATKTEPLTGRDPLSTKVRGALRLQKGMVNNRNTLTTNASLDHRSIPQKSHSKESIDDVDDSISLANDCSLITSGDIKNHDHFITKNFSCDSGVAETIELSSISTLEELKDSATSSTNACPKAQKQAVSYSGKSTATILQELLSALNPSARPLVYAKDHVFELSDTTRTYEDGKCPTILEKHAEGSCFDSEEDLDSTTTSVDLNQKDILVSSDRGEGSFTTTCVDLNHKDILVSSDRGEGLFTVLTLGFLRF